MDLLDELLAATPDALERFLAQGHPVDPTALDDTEYHGTSLGLPAFVEAVSWKTFKKVFRRDPATRTLRGWNVAVEQSGPHGDFRDRTRGGRRVTYGHYEVLPAGRYLVPNHHDRGLMLDYGRMARPWSPFRPVRDTVVAVEAGSVKLLLGWMYLDLGLLRVPTRSYFTLQRGGPLTYDLTPPLLPAQRS
jgi:hypothetical protein